MKGKCDACMGKGIDPPLGITTFRNHNLCGPCEWAWKVLDRLFQGELQRDATWEEFLHEKCPLCPTNLPLEKVRGKQHHFKATVLSSFASGRRG